jgi:hypothetical protein
MEEWTRGWRSGPERERGAKDRRRRTKKRGATRQEDERLRTRRKRKKEKKSFSQGDNKIYRIKKE